MAETFRGGNSRVLARQLDQLSWPVIALDQRQQIVFVSSALCELLQVDATRLVGLVCSAQLASDPPVGQPAADQSAIVSSIPPQLSMMLAPPPAVLHGQAAVRQVPWPPHAPTGFAGQAFLPLIDDDPSTGLILILFGQADQLRQRFQPLAPAVPPSGAGGDEMLLRLRAQWEQLDGLWPLLGSSTAIQLAMRRAQLALENPAHVLISGPAGSGKSRLARSLAALRRRSLELPGNLINQLEIECSLMDPLSLEAQLESFSSRMRAALPPYASQLILDRVDCLSPESAKQLGRWVMEIKSGCCVVATSQRRAEQWSSSNISMARLAQQLSTVEIDIPPLAVRREDVLTLLEHHLTQAAHKTGRRLPSVATTTQEMLQAYPWPGNADEVQQAAAEMLANAILTATIQPTHLPLQLRTFASTINRPAQNAIEPISLDEVLEDLERIMLQRALKLSPRNRARAARMLGISRPRFLRRIAQLGLDEPIASDEEE